MSELRDLDVLVVDCQTTGATPLLGAVLEIGWCVVRPAASALDRLEAHWVQLPQGQRVSPRVRELTGYDERNQLDALEPQAAWQRLCACTQAAPMPTAIHYARFELGFLQDWAQRFAPAAPFPFEAVCVHAIARRLYPDLPRRSLRALAGHLGHGLDLRRHALGHVEATAFIWRKLALELEGRGVRTWTELGEWLERREALPPRPKRRTYPLPSSRYRALPDEPGVYQLLRSNGDVLYVGKAMSLRKRVASHFTARSNREHSIEMLTQVNDVRVTVTASALEAALLENETIKSLRPPYNVQLTSYEAPAWYAASSFHEAAPAPSDSHRIGPLPSELALRPLGAMVALGAHEPAATRLRARALATAERWAPEDDVFAAGFALFAQRHLDVAASSSSAARRTVLAAAKRLIAASRLELAESEPAADEAEAPSSVPSYWDPERVARHLERALHQSYQLLRRAMWLRLLEDSAVVYREPESSRTRLLCVRRAELIEARDVEAGDEALGAVTAPPRPRGRKLGAALSRPQYDRLRILTSELKRVRRDGGAVAVYVAPARRLGERVLDAVFRAV